MNNLSVRDGKKSLNYPAVVFAILLIGGGYWYFTQPSEEELDREHVCKNWHYTDDASLARCRKSSAEMNAVIAPRFNAAGRTKIAEFNSELTAITKTSVDVSAYRPAEIAVVSKAIGSIFPTLKKAADQPLYGQRLVLKGQIVTNTPHPEDEEDGGAGRTWEPRTFSLWGPWTKGKNTITPMVKIDIESLNREERRFIQRRCESLSFVKCDAVVYGHVGAIEEDDTDFIYFAGFIVDQVEIKPLGPDSYRKL